MNQKTGLIILLLITGTWVLLFLPCGGLALATVFLADGHPNPDAFALVFFGSLSFPLAIILTTPLAWLAYFFKRYILAIFISLLPIPTLILPIIGFSML